MTKKQNWNDESREKLRNTLRSTIRGELRLGKYAHEQILDTCRVVYIKEESPHLEWERFIKFSSDEIRRAAEELESERTNWPEETDCDRLDRAELALRKRGILLWQASPCCDTCTGGELPDRIDAIQSRDQDFRSRVRGYAFFIEQNMPELLAENTNLTVYLAYGWLTPENSNVSQKVYENNALGIAREVCQCLADQKFEVDWDGSMSRKIGISLNWQRRKMLD